MVVVDCRSRPLYVWVLPRTTDLRASSAGVLVPKGVIKGLNKDGRFMYRPYRVAIEEVEALEVFVHLTGRWLEKVLAEVNAVELELD